LTAIKGHGINPVPCAFARQFEKFVDKWKYVGIIALILNLFIGGFRNGEYHWKGNKRKRIFLF
jgi:hypothetical protein